MIKCMRTLIASVVVSCTVVMPAHAITVGVFGHVFPIKEQDVLLYIHDKLLAMKADGSLAKAKADFIKRVKAHTLRPTPVAGIGTTDHPQTRYFDPSFTLTRDIVDADGKVIYHKGLMVNPLNPILAGQYRVRLFNEIVIFIDGDDAKELAWVKAHINDYARSKIVLIKGNIKTTTQALQSRIYFDQKGILCHHFGITHVPTLMSRDGERLKLQEIGSSTLDQAIQEHAHAK